MRHTTLNETPINMQSEEKGEADESKNGDIFCLHQQNLANKNKVDTTRLMHALYGAGYARKDK